MPAHIVIIISMAGLGVMVFIYCLAQHINFEMTVRDIRHMRNEKIRQREEKIRELTQPKNALPEPVFNADAARVMSQNLKKLID